MRKKAAVVNLALVSLTAVLIVTIPDATAGTRAPAVYLGGGLTFPTGPDTFRTNHKTGSNIVAGLTYPVTPYLELGGELEYHFITVDFQEYFQTNLELGGGGIDILLIGMDLRLDVRRVTKPFRPFFLAGGGWSRLWQMNITGQLAFEQYAPLLIENQTGSYYDLGAGADFKFTTSFTMVLVIRYIEIKQEEDNLKLLPVTLGIKF